MGILLITPFVVKAEDAGNAVGNPSQHDLGGIVTTSTTPAPLDETVTLHLDRGFVGRSASLGLFNDRVVIAWDAKTLVAPAVLTVTRTHGGVGNAGQTEAAKGVAISFDGDSPVHEDGKIRVIFKADRPPGPSERIYGRVFVGSVSSTVDATFKKDSITIALGAGREIAIVPYFESGIMRSGLASWYKYKNCHCAASPDVPKGTRLKVSRQDDPKRFIVVTVNDFGPDRKIHPERVIDLDKVAFAKIGNPRGGVLAVTVDVLSPDDPLYALGDLSPPKKLVARK